MTTIPRFTDIELGTEADAADGAAEYEALKDTAGHTAGWQTPEHILVPPLYGDADLYHGFAFANAMNNLTSTMSSSFDAARAAGMTASTGSSSGFSGFSGGGGFGGGGGGSW